MYFQMPRTWGAFYKCYVPCSQQAFLYISPGLLHGASACGTRGTKQVADPSFAATKHLVDVVVSISGSFCEEMQLCIIDLSLVATVKPPT